MNYPEPRDPWHRQNPVPPVPGQPEAAATAAYPVSPAPARGWWGRLNPLPRALLIVAAPLVLCCGGLTGIGAFAGDAAKDAAPVPSTVPADPARPAEPTLTVPPTPADTASATPTPTPSAAAATRAATAKQPAPAKTTRAPRPVYYANCAAVRDAGEAPLRRGEPGYRAGLDRDGDGVACESSEGSGSTGGGSTGGDDPPQSNVYYKNCTAARAAGAAPVRRGDPGYGRHLDRDGDGVACE